MRGYPLLRALAAFLVLLALAPALWRLTRIAPAPAAGAPVPPGIAAEQQVEMRLNFSAPAGRVTIFHLGKEVWTKSRPSPEEEADFQIPWPKEGVEMRVTAEWEGAASMAAIRLRITGPDGRDYDRSIWGKGSADEVVTFP